MIRFSNHIPDGATLNPISVDKIEDIARMFHEDHDYTLWESDDRRRMFGKVDPISGRPVSGFVVMEICDNRPR